MANIKKRKIILNALGDIKLHDAGMKQSKTESRPVQVSEPRIDYPTLYLNAKQTPELVGYEVDDNVILVINGKITSHSKSNRIGSPGRETFDIEIKQIGCNPKKV